MLYDIFSKKKTRNSNKPLPKIIADIHEKDSMIFSEIKSCEEVQLIIQPLKIGDYLIGETIIERKTGEDFISSMLSKRLVDQLNQMQTYTKKILIIEGELESIHSKINPNAVRGFILSILIHRNIPIIFTKSPKETASYLIILAKKETKPKVESSMHERIPKTIEEQKQYILEAFPNIGPSKSKKLLEKFKSLDKTFNASVEELNDILKNDSQKFKDILNKE